jgi:hypothetical protein
MAEYKGSAAIGLGASTSVNKLLDLSVIINTV